MIFGTRFATAPEGFVQQAAHVVEKALKATEGPPGIARSWKLPRAANSIEELLAASRKVSVDSSHEAGGVSAALAAAEDDLRTSLEGFGKTLGKNKPDFSGVRDALTSAQAKYREAQRVLTGTAPAEAADEGQRLLRERLPRFFGTKPASSVAAQAAGPVLYRPPAIPPTLARYTTNLTAQALRVPPIVGRDDVIRQMIDVLGRTEKNSVALIGKAGTGKTATAMGLAQRIVRRDVPDHLRDVAVLSLNMDSLQGGTNLRGEFEGRMAAIVNEVQQANGRIVLFIDEMHTALNAGSHSAADNVGADILKTALTDPLGRFRTIGATTLDEFRKVEKDPAFARRFTRVVLDAPKKQQTIDMLKGRIDTWQRAHGVVIPEKLLPVALRMTDRAMPGNQPDKTISLLDEAASALGLEAMRKASPELDAARTAMTAASTEVEGLMRAKKHVPAELNARLQEAMNRVDSAEAAAKAALAANPPVLTERHLAQIVTKTTGIPVARMSAAEGKRALRAADELHKRVIGQEDAVEAVASALHRVQAGLNDPKRPIASMLFLGPTGIGKTELAKALQEFQFGDETELVRLNMGEFSNGDALSKFIGVAGGQVEGQLTEPVRQKPFRVVLLDEIEKAHDELQKPLLSILDDGTMKDGQGREVSFRNTVIIMTSNLGSKALTRGVVDDEARQTVMKALKQRYTPEFLNRIDKMVMFRSLREDEIRKVVDLSLKSVQARLKETGIRFEATPEARDYLGRLGYSPTFGARPLRRVMQTEIEDALAVPILQGKVAARAPLTMDVRENTVVFEQKGKVVLEMPAKERHPAVADLEGDGPQDEMANIQDQLKNLFNNNGGS